MKAPVAVPVNESRGPLRLLRVGLAKVNETRAKHWQRPARTEWTRNSFAQTTVNELELEARAPPSLLQGLGRISVALASERNPVNESTTLLQ